MALHHPRTATVRCVCLVMKPSIDGQGDVAGPIWQLEVRQRRGTEYRRGPHLTASALL